jgi:hypothetical protein
MGTKNVYVVIPRAVNAETRYSVHNKSEAKGKQFVAQFVRQADAYDFIDMLEAKERK